jgi:5-formyltetrahydrofolate cyclo-ligase
MIEPAGATNEVVGANPGSEHLIEDLPPSTPVAVVKGVLRARMRQWLRTMTPETRRQASEAACRRLEAQEVWRQARAILIYAPRQDELDITDLVDQALSVGKILALPQYQAEAGCYRACRLEVPIRQLPIGRYGIPEPGSACAVVPLDRLDIALVPGVAFDVSGHRLGRGQGYYDRLLANLGGIKCGVGFDTQVQPRIPVEPHDAVLDRILTPTRWVAVRSLRHGNNVVG